MPQQHHNYLSQIYNLNSSSSSQPAANSNNRAVGGTGHVAELNLAMQASRQRTQSTTQELRPNATKLAYYPKMSEFCKWCDDMKFPEPIRYQVNGDKLHLFLEQVVIGRIRRPTIRKQLEANAERQTNDHHDLETEQEEHEFYTIGFSTIEQYVSAIIQLFHDQCGLRLNDPSNNPRIPDVKSLLKNERKKDIKRRRTNFKDRAAGSILDGYSTIEELAKIIDYFLTRDRSEHYRNAVMMLVSHFAFMRGENVRQIELADIHVIPLQGEGPTPDKECPCLILLLDHGKTNQFGKAEHGSAIRCAHVETCLWMALGLYFFHRWHIQGEPFPDMTRPQTWYNIKLCKSDPADLTKNVEQPAHYKALKKAFDACKIVSTAVTHAGRKSGAKMADMGEAGDSAIRRAGRWTSDAMEGSYLTNLPRRQLRAMATFDANGKTFWLPRDGVQPSETLQKKVFPWVDQWQEKIDQGEGDKSVAADGFLKMLRVLRKTFLQDSVPMMKRHPQLSIWNAPIFSDPEYTAFKNDLATSIETAPPPEDLTLSRAMPQLHGFLRQMYTDLNQKVDRNTQLVEEHNRTFNQFMGDLANGRLTISVQWTPQSQSTNVPVNTTPSAANSPAATVAPSFAALTDTAPSIADTITPQIPSNNTPMPATTSSSLFSTAQLPHYRLNDGVATVTDLWREWHEGISGGPAIKDLELQWKTKWRRDQAKKFNRRNAVIKGVEKFIEYHSLQQQNERAIRMVELWRQNPKVEWCAGGEQKPRSLHWMGENVEKWKHVEMFPGI